MRYFVKEAMPKTLLYQHTHNRSAMGDVYPETALGSAHGHHIIEFRLIEKLLVKDGA